MNICVNIVTIEDGKVPVYKTNGSAGADCFARMDAVIAPKETKIIPLGFAVEVPSGYELQIRPRSGLASKGKVCMFGTIDSDYRGEVGAIIHNNTDEEFVVNKGDRIAQCILAPVTKAEFVPCLTLTETKRGSGGFGSTGK